MAKFHSQKIEYALGLFTDGQNLYTTCLAKKDHKIRLIDAEVYSLSHSPATEAASTGSANEMANMQSSAYTEKGIRKNGDRLPQNGYDEPEVLLANDDFLQDDEILIDLEKEGLEEQLSENEDKFLLPQRNSVFSKNFAEILHQVLQKYPRTIKLAFSFQEPLVYYVKFFHDWGVKEVKLKHRIKEELEKENPNLHGLTIDDIHILKTASSGLIALINDRSDQFWHTLTTYEKDFNKRLPRISFLESADISLVNLVHFNSHFQAEEMSLIVHICAESSRLIFLLGETLFHVSARIDAGACSTGLLETIYNRIILEQDNLNIPVIERIIITGPIDAGAAIAYFSRVFASKDQKTTVEEIDLSKLIINDPNQWPPEKLAEFAVPIGAAWRVLEQKINIAMPIDLLPAKIREKQQILRLGLSGWLAMIFIFATTLFFTHRIGLFQKTLVEKQQQLQIKTLELNNLQEIQKELFRIADKLDSYSKTFAVYDSMMANTSDWYGFLNNISDAGNRHRGIWLTEISPKGQHKVSVKGYALYRNRIAKFSQDIGEAILTRAEVAKIREQTVYAFELTATIPLKTYGMPEHAHEAISVISANGASSTLPKPDKPEITNSKSQIPNHKFQKSLLIGQRFKGLDTNGSHAEKNIDVQAKTTGALSLAVGNRQEFKAHYEQGRQLFERRKYAGAIDVFRTLIESPFQSPLRVNCYYWIGESYFGLRNYHKAIAYFQIAAKEESSKKGAALLMLGRSYAALGQKTQAMKHLNLALEARADKSMHRKANYYKMRLR